MSSQYDPSDYALENEDDEYLTRVVVDTCSRTFYMYSNEGDTKEVSVDTTDQFMDILEIVRCVCNEDIVFYSDLVVAGWPLYYFNFSLQKGPIKNLGYFWLPLLFMNFYKPSFYEEILTCYDYETRNPTVYGNVIFCKVEYSKSSKKCRINW